MYLNDFSLTSSFTIEEILFAKCELKDKYFTEPIKEKFDLKIKFITNLISIKKSILKKLFFFLMILIFLSKFFGRIPIVGPLVITIVSLLSGEPASQAIFKGLGAALGGALGTFIPIPILGTLIGETIGVFVGDLLYESEIL